MRGRPGAVPALGARIARLAPGRTTFDEMLTVHRTLHETAQRATGLLPELTRLDVPFGAPVVVVSRERWVSATLTSLEPHLAAAQALPPVSARVSARASARVSAALSAQGIGAGFALASHRVLANFDPLAGEHGTLLLVAPNLLQRQQQTGIDLADLCLWTSLHEQTHQAQFQASAWLHGFLPLALEVLFAAFEGRTPGPTLAAQVPGCSVACRARGAEDPAERAEFTGLLGGIRDRELRHAAAHVFAIMALLEGHATHVMNAVDARALPSIAALKRTLSPDRTPGPLQRVIARAVGLHEKQAQYRDGERFVSSVVREASLIHLNRVWADPSALPSLGELQAPLTWLERVGEPGDA